MAAKWLLKTNAYRVLVGICEGKRRPGRQIDGWEHNIKIEIQEIRLWGCGWTELICLMTRATSSFLSTQ
jgi:hypothetical protein